MQIADESFNGRVVQLAVGEAFEIRLAENASTGFRWSAPAGLKLLRQLDDSAEGEATPGRAGVRTFRFEAMEPGTVELRLQYRRPWESDRPAAREFQLEVLVSALRATPA